MSTMGSRIRTLRQQHHMTQDELGQYLRVGRSAVLKYEKGEVENIPRNAIIKMSDLFGVEPAYLMAFDQIDDRIDEHYHEIGESQRAEVYAKAKWGDRSISIMDSLSKLTPSGQSVVSDIIAGLLSNPKYTK